MYTAVGRGPRRVRAHEVDDVLGLLVRLDGQRLAQLAGVLHTALLEQARGNSTRTRGEKCSLKGRALLLDGAHAFGNTLFTALYLLDNIL